ncbi:Initiation-specific alpha-1,6-mannosyltransferase [Wickerhamomyces ciferrii]|uniref:Initiation-specific alpha-1,6-mannosyltransferase n=1 Tax=Wickerhamomyces ciferrii (strain ATCC 14091 / BCRC 22168 / CBS 111 / JCM 3599 / NBRC 0793 / NRRL Y-1031 F-60-10) TaxID=1206466 RepID=K0KM01_WICCF|nr:Initiation-specific alpha-1,6-mannosyltransferase [Wickerhamomyces ciferrii]CCH42389.1 Initiation-specific alpha-1,6-mannosyltransferase [Wickerhamomyces ciferrii]
MIIKNKKTTAIILISTVLLTLFLKCGSQFKSIANKHAQQLYLKYSYGSVDEYRVASYSNDEMDQIRRNLSIHFPYKKNTDEIPKNIWQIWKSDNISTLDEGLQDLIHSWKDQENFTYTLVQDTKLGEFLHDSFIDTAPAVLKALDKLPEIILKTDFARYLFMFAYGGVYSDIDTRSNHNITNWLSYNNTITPDLPNQVGLVMGIESDNDQKEFYRGEMARRLQYCQWTLQSKPGHPMYRELVSRIVDLTLNHFDPETMTLTKDGKKFNLKKGSSTRMAGILDWTGPGIVTDAVFDYLNDVYKTSELLNPELDFKNDKMIDPNRELNLFSRVKYQLQRGFINNGYDPLERPLGWQNFTKQVRPILFDDDVLLLPQKSFAGFDGGPLNYVRHFFKGTWKNN